MLEGERHRFVERHCASLAERGSEDLGVQRRPDLLDGVLVELSLGGPGKSELQAHALRFGSPEQPRSRCEVSLPRDQ